jgi:hypothetical protein
LGGTEFAVIALGLHESSHLQQKLCRFACWHGYLFGKIIAFRNQMDMGLRTDNFVSKLIWPMGGDHGSAGPLTGAWRPDPASPVTFGKSSGSRCWSRTKSTCGPSAGASTATTRRRTSSPTVICASSLRSPGAIAATALETPCTPSSMHRSTLRTTHNAPLNARSPFRHGARAFRRRAPAAAIELGRTRIGIETGPAVVGDVGIRSKLDYMAHGDAVNMAARLEACNKELGSVICVGPGAAARCDAALLRPLGQLAVRGRAEPITVFEPWPSDAPPAWREAYQATYAMLDCDAARAAMLLQKLMVERPLDPAVRRLAERLPSMRKSGL